MVTMMRGVGSPSQGKPDLSGLPLAAYVRVSANAAERESEDRLSSPIWQLSDAQEAGRREGFPVREYPAELDVTGSKAARKVLDQILRDIEAGEVGGIVVAKLDRLSRMAARDRLEMFERVEAAGGRVVSAAESLDDTPEGRFTRDLFLGIARMQWEKYRDTFLRAKRDALARGAKVGSIPFGYMKGPRGVLLVCEIEGPIVQQAFRLAASGDINRVVAYLREAAPVRVRDSVAKRGRRQRQKGDPRNWTHRAVRNLLKNRTYLGEVWVGDENVKETHQPLVTLSEFVAADAVERNKKTRNTGRRGRYPLAAALTCDNCGLPCVGSMSGAKGSQRLVYRCGTDGSRRSKEDKAVLKCERRGYVNAAGLEAYLTEWLRAEYPRRAFVEPSEDAVAHLAASELVLADAERELDDFLADTENAAKLRRVNRYDAAMDARVLAVESARAALGAALDVTQSVAREVPDWDALSPADLADLLADLGAEVFIRQGGRGVREIAPRVAIVLPGDDESSTVAAL